jgi:Eukaryotic DNA topoisomerase I, DNA binding fragment
MMTTMMMRMMVVVQDSAGRTTWTRNRTMTTPIRTTTKNPHVDAARLQNKQRPVKRLLNVKANRKRHRNGYVPRHSALAQGVVHSCHTCQARSATPRKAPAVKSEATASSVSRKTKSTAGAAAPKRSKELKPLEQLDMAMKAFKWWEAPPLPRDERWAYIEHSGVYFSPEYTRHNVKMKYDGQV